MTLRGPYESSLTPGQRQLNTNRKRRCGRLSFDCRRFLAKNRAHERREHGQERNDREPVGLKLTGEIGKRKPDPDHERTKSNQPNEPKNRGLFHLGTFPNGRIRLTHNVGNGTEVGIFEQYYGQCFNQRYCYYGAGPLGRLYLEPLAAFRFSGFSASSSGTTKIPSLRIKRLSI